MSARIASSWFIVPVYYLIDLWAARRVGSSKIKGQGMLSQTQNVLCHVFWKQKDLEDFASGIDIFCKIEAKFMTYCCRRFTVHRDVPIRLLLGGCCCPFYRTLTSVTFYHMSKTLPWRSVDSFLSLKYFSAAPHHTKATMPNPPNISLEPMLEWLTQRSNVESSEEIPLIFLIPPAQMGPSWRSKLFLKALYEAICVPKGSKPH